MRRQMVTMTMDHEVIQRVKEIKGDVPFSRWIERATINRLEEEEVKPE